MKKWIALLLAALFVLSMVGCQKKIIEEEKIIGHETANKKEGIYYDKDGNSEEYDANGNLIEKITYRNGQIKLREKYNSNGDITEYTTYVDDGIPTTRCVYEYNENHEWTKITDYHNSDAFHGGISWYINSMVEFEYDAHDRETMHKSWGVWREGVLYDPSKLVIDSWYEYEYDINGNRVKETSYDEDGGIEYWYEYEYDSNGHRTKTTKYADDGSIIDE